jgi:hypothetical protein
MGFQRDRVRASLRTFIDQFFLDYACAQGKCRWADKTPAYVDCLEAIDEVYQASPRYVMIYRHGLDVACSLTRTLPDYVERLDNHSSVQDRHDPIRVAAAHWREEVGKMQAFQAVHGERCFELRYEELMKSPETVLRAMFDFLGEPFEEQVLRFNDQAHVEVTQDVKVAFSRTFEPSQANYRRLSEVQLQAAIEEAEPALSTLGYRV